MKPNEKNDDDRVTCPICGHRIRSSFLTVHVTAEQWTLKRIQQDHPEWREEDGVCTRCWDHYRNLAVKGI